MSTGIYIGVSGKARKVKKMYVGIGGKARKVLKAYIGVAGKARLFYIAPTSLTIGTTTTIDISSYTGTSYYNSTNMYGRISSTKVLFVTDTYSASSQVTGLCFDSSHTVSQYGTLVSSGNGRNTIKCMTNLGNYLFGFNRYGSSSYAGYGNYYFIINSSGTKTEYTNLNNSLATYRGWGTYNNTYLYLAGGYSMSSSSTLYDTIETVNTSGTSNLLSITLPTAKRFYSSGSSDSDIVQTGTNLVVGATTSSDVCICITSSNTINSSISTPTHSSYMRGGTLGDYAAFIYTTNLYTYNSSLTLTTKSLSKNEGRYPINGCLLGPSTYIDSYLTEVSLSSTIFTGNAYTNNNLADMTGAKEAVNLAIYFDGDGTNIEKISVYPYTS